MILKKIALMFNIPVIEKHHDAKACFELYNVKDGSIAVAIFTVLISFKMKFL